MATSTKSQLQLNPISRDRVNLNSQTITTARCVSLQPVCVHEIVPGDSFNVNMHQFNRVDALPVSSFIQFKNRTAAFFVKNSQVWKPYDAFKTGAPYAFGYQNIVPTKKPYLSLLDVHNCFTGFYSAGDPFALTTLTDISERVQSVEDCERILADHEYDFIQFFGEGDAEAFTLTELGRVFYKVIYQLGYRAPHLLDASKGFDQLIQTEQSLLPLMSYLSIMVNYYVPLKWRDYQFVNSMSYLVDPVPQHFQNYIRVGDASQAFVTWLISVVRLVARIYYGDDYFTSSLVDPMVVPTGQSSMVVEDPSSLGPQVDVESGSHRTPRITTDPDQAFTQYLVYALSCVTGQAQLSAMTLNDIKAATLAKFGYKAECADMVPYLLDKVDDVINVRPELSTADTYDEQTGTGVPVGYKAGTGEGVAQFSFNSRFDSYGTLIVMNSIMPNYFYFNGVRRSLLRVTQQEEFDRNYSKLGYQAIARAELDADILNPVNTFGFTRKYGDMAKGNDILGGDFIINTANNGLDSFHFGRKVNPNANNNEAFSVATTGVNRAWSLIDGQQFNRVFVESSTDPIQQWYIWNIKATRLIEFTMTVGDNDGEIVETKSVGETLNS